MSITIFCLEANIHTITFVFFSEGVFVLEVVEVVK